MRACVSTAQEREGKQKGVTENEEDKRASRLAALKKLLLNPKKGVRNDEHPACSFHIEEIAFGNIELTDMMK